MANNTLHIHVDWTGPHLYAEALALRNEDTDFGVYQIYGSHPVYGAAVLLYIGKAESQTFGARLAQQSWSDYNPDSSRVFVHVGRLSGYGLTPSDTEWSNQIALVERLLIYAHRPAENSSGLKVAFGQDLHHIHVLNWGEYRALLPEVSGARYSDRYASTEGYGHYGASRRAKVCRRFVTSQSTEGYGHYGASRHPDA